MVSQQAPGKELPAEPGDDIVEEIQEQVTVGAVEENAAMGIPGRRD
jgi:hypothetical protein